MDLSPVALLLELRRRGVFLRSDRDRIGFRRGSLGPEDLDRLREAKEDILALLRAERENEPIPAGPCRACRGRRYWFGGPGPTWACGKCHPPGDPAFVRAWHELSAQADPGKRESLPVGPERVREARRPIWADLSAGERAMIAKVRDAHAADFDALLLRYFSEGLISGEAEVRVVLDLLDRELRLDNREGLAGGPLEEHG